MRWEAQGQASLSRAPRSSLAREGQIFPAPQDPLQTRCIPLPHSPPLGRPRAPVAGRSQEPRRPCEGEGQGQERWPDRCETRLPSQWAGEVAVHTTTIKWRFHSTGLDLGFLISIVSLRQRTGCQTQRSSQQHQGASSPVSQVRNLSSQPESARRSLRLVRGGGEIPTRPSGCENKEPATQATQPVGPQSPMCQLTPSEAPCAPGTVLSAVCTTTLRNSPRTTGGRGCPTPTGQVGKQLKHGGHTGQPGNKRQKRGSEPEAKALSCHSIYSLPPPNITRPSHQHPQTEAEP